MPLNKPSSMRSQRPMSELNREKTILHSASIDDSHMGAAALRYVVALRAWDWRDAKDHDLYVLRAERDGLGARQNPPHQGPRPFVTGALASRRYRPQKVDPHGTVATWPPRTFLDVANACFDEMRCEINERQDPLKEMT